MPTAIMTSKGQITIPVKVRKALGLKPGVRIDFYEIKDGEYAFRPRTGSIMEMRGCLQKLDYVPTIEQMDRDILEASSADFLASLDNKGSDSADGEAA